MGIDQALAPAAVLGHLAAFLLVASVLIPTANVARIAALAAGAGALLYALIGIGSPSVALWAAAFIAGHVWRLLQERRPVPARRHGLSPEAHYFHQSAVPFLSPEKARALIEVGAEFSTGTDAVLIREGDISHELYFITDGTVTIESGNRPVATVAAGSFIGEISLMTGEPATASAVSISPVRCIAFSREALERLFDEDPDLKDALELGFKRALREKLVRANKAMSGAASAKG